MLQKVFLCEIELTLQKHTTLQRTHKEFASLYYRKFYFLWSYIAEWMYASNYVDVNIYIYFKVPQLSSKCFQKMLPKSQIPRYEWGGKKRTRNIKFLAKQSLTNIARSPLCKEWFTRERIVWINLRGVKETNRSRWEWFSLLFGEMNWQKE